VKFLVILPLLLTQALLTESNRAIDALFLIAENPQRNIPILCSSWKAQKWVKFQLTHRTQGGHYINVCPIKDGVYSRRHFKFDIIVHMGESDFTVWSVKKKI